MTPTTPPSLEALVAAAVHAPSLHNTQPWLVRCAGDTVELYADRTRALPVNDPFDRVTLPPAASAPHATTLRAAVHRPCAAC